MSLSSCILIFSECFFLIVGLQCLFFPSLFSLCLCEASHLPPFLCLPCESLSRMPGAPWPVPVLEDGTLMWAAARLCAGLGSEAGQSLTLGQTIPCCAGKPRLSVSAGVSPDKNVLTTCEVALAFRRASKPPVNLVVGILEPGGGKVAR